MRLRALSWTARPEPAETTKPVASEGTYFLAVPHQSSRAQEISFFRRPVPEGSHKSVISDESSSALDCLDRPRQN